MPRLLRCRRQVGCPSSIPRAIACVALLLSSVHHLTAFAPPLPLQSGRHHIPRSATATALSSSVPASTYDMIVVGGGSAGLTAAKFAATFGKSVVLVESARVGGDCTWTGCVPSKTMLAAAKRAWTWRKMNEKYGTSVDDASLRKMLSDVKEEVDATRSRIYEADDIPEVLKSLGIDLAEGRAHFCDDRTVYVTNQRDGTTRQLNAKYGIVVATGATPRDYASGIPGLDSVEYWTYENVWEKFFTAIEKNQQGVRDTTVIVVGGGPIGCELSQAISRLGCSVVLISRSPRISPKSEAEASLELQQVLEKEGISVICNQKVASVSKSESGDGSISVSLNSGETISGHHILVATGRIPNTKGMGLDEIGVQLNSRNKGVEVNKKLETCIKGIFAAGDCTGDRQFTHYAGFQGAIAARNILLPLKDPGVLSEVPSTTFTDPEVSAFGLSEQAAVAQFGDDAVSVAFRPLSKVDRAVCEGTDAHGFIKIIYRSKSNQILGATVMAPAAGELISELAVASETGVSLDKLATVMHTYPSYSIAIQQMAADVYYDKLKKSMPLCNVLKAVGL